MSHISDFWNCDPDLKEEWESFAAESSKFMKKNSISDQWLSFCTHKETTGEVEIPVQRSISSQETVNCSESINNNLSHPCSAENEDSIRSDAQLSALQQQQVNSLALELVDIFEIGTAAVSEEIKDELGTLSQKARQCLLTEMTSQLSDQGAYNLCASLFQADEDQWMDVTSVLEFILFPMVCGNPPKPAGAELLAGIMHISRQFPSECVSTLLKPLLNVQSAAAVQIELVSSLVPSLPLSDFMALLRHFNGICSGPLQEWQLSILNALLSRVKPDDCKSSLESIVLDLLPVLSLSARQMTRNESFGCLVLKIVQCLKSGVSQKVCSELSVIAHQCNSFSTRAILNALKAL